MKDAFSDKVKSITFRIKCDRITYIRSKFKYRKYKKTGEFTGVYDIDYKPLCDGDIVQFADCDATKMKDIAMYQIRKKNNGEYVITDGKHELKPYKGQFYSALKIEY